MVLFFQILLCALATFGLYALFARAAVSLLRGKDCHLALVGDGKTAEEVLALAALAALRLEGDKELSRDVVILLNENHDSLEKALLAEGFLVYKRENT
ncbi:MAG: hypothetical protein J6S44_03055 [Clostridia bacterium]|nr:hypothetical protein [Clostridia bacterium]MBO5755110.1 hypothetical protein [Clostridia bacterium]MBO7170443.1 hypothetical protein [Clostridia bacterium]